MPYAEDAFGSLGDLDLLPGHRIDRDAVREADALLVRSVTRIDAQLLAGSRVGFVGTATSGFDHIDLDHLSGRGVRFAYAPGSNANSVAEYVVAALLTISEARGLNLQGARVGIIGCGHVGRRVRERLDALSAVCVLHDPPLADSTSDPVYRPLSEALECDVATLHVPLEREGPYPTFHLVDEGFLSSLRDGAVLINASRGAVVDEAALLGALRAGRLGGCALDVWENEPTPNPELVELVDIATPHIAGYSYDGKVAGTFALYRSLCEFMQIEPVWAPPVDSADRRDALLLDSAAGNPVGIAVMRAYDILQDSDALDRIVTGPGDSAAAEFRTYRKNYRERREFAHVRVATKRLDPRIISTLRCLGFST